MMLLTAFAAIGLMSCNKEDVVEKGGNNPIGFHCADVQTRALISSADDMQEDGFAVYAQATFYKDGVALSEDPYTFNRVVTYSSGVWNYVDPEYWLPNGSYTFHAYFPAEFPATISEDGESFTSFTLAPQYGTQQDILMASATRTTAEVPEKGPTVPFAFTHLLSNLNVTLKVAAEEVDVTDEDNNPVDSDGDGVTDKEWMNLIDASVKAVAFTGVTETADYEGGAWINHTGSMAVGDNMDSPIEVTRDGVSIFGSDGLLAIPETIAAGDVSLYVLADITLPNGSQMQKDWTLNLPAITWSPNTKYNYTATLTADFNIEFEEPAVESWGREQMSGTVIIR